MGVHLLPESDAPRGSTDKDDQRRDGGYSRSATDADRLGAPRLGGGEDALSRLPASRWPGAPDLVLYFDERLREFGYDENANQALQRTRPSRFGRNHCVPWAGSLSLGR